MKLTSERCNGIKTGYWSPHKKEILVQKLGAIEHKAPDAVDKICDHYCRFPPMCSDEETLHEKHCDRCPVGELYRLILEEPQ